MSPNVHHIHKAILQGGYISVNDKNIDNVFKFLRDRIEPEYDHAAPILPEAPAAWNLTYYMAGRREQITLRGMTYAEIAVQADAARKWIDGHADASLYGNGQRESLPQASGAPIEPIYEDIVESATLSTDDGWERGVGHCVMMSLTKSYSSGKPQLQFECDNLEHPLRYTKGIEDMKELLKTAGVSKPLVAGQEWKIGGEWNIDWAMPPAKNPGDTRYRNVQSVSRAAQPA